MCVRHCICLRASRHIIDFLFCPCCMPAGLPSFSPFSYSLPQLFPNTKGHVLWFSSRHFLIFYFFEETFRNFANFSTLLWKVSKILHFSGGEFLEFVTFSFRLSRHKSGELSDQFQTKSTCFRWFTLFFINHMNFCRELIISRKVFVMWKRLF